MTIYTNGAEIGICSDIVRITFVDVLDKESVTVAKIAMHYSVLKQLYEGIGNCMMQHEAKLKDDLK